MSDEYSVIFVGVGIVLALVAMVMNGVMRSNIEGLEKSIRDIRKSVDALSDRCGRTDLRTDRIDKSINTIYEDLSDHNTRLRYIESALYDREDEDGK